MPHSAWCPGSIESLFPICPPPDVENRRHTSLLRVLVVFKKQHIHKQYAKVPSGDEFSVKVMKRSQAKGNHGESTYPEEAANISWYLAFVIAARVAEKMSVKLSIARTVLSSEDVVPIAQRSKAGPTRKIKMMREMSPFTQAEILLRSQ